MAISERRYAGIIIVMIRVDGISQKNIEKNFIPHINVMVI